MSAPEGSAIDNRRPGSSTTEGGHTSRGPARGADGRFLAPLMLGALLNPLNSSMIATALVPIGRALGEPATRTVWLVSSLYLASAIGQPAAGRIADRVGARPVFFGGLGLVALAGLAGALAPTLPALVAARAALGLGTATAYPAAMVLLRQRAAARGEPPPRATLAALSVTAQVSAAVGPALGGLLLALGGWRLLFAINVPLALAGSALAARGLPASMPAAPAADMAATEADAEAAAATAAAATRNDWAGLGRTYARHTLMAFVIYCVFYGFVQWLEEAAALTPARAGLVMLPMMILSALGAAGAARSRRPWRALVAAAALFVAGGATLLAAHHQSPLLLFVVVAALFGLPQGPSAVGNQTALYVQAGAGVMGAAAGLLRTAQYLGAIAATGAIAVSFGARPGDAGLHRLGAAVVVAALALFTLTAADARLRAIVWRARPAHSPTR